MVNNILKIVYGFCLLIIVIDTCQVSAGNSNLTRYTYKYQPTIKIQDTLASLIPNACVLDSSGRYLGSSGEREPTNKIMCSFCIIHITKVTYSILHSICELLTYAMNLCFAIYL